MTRKLFLQAGTAALATAVLGPLARAEDEPAPKKRALKKAVNLGMANARGASVADRFKMIRDAGFDGIEVNRPDAIPIDDRKCLLRQLLWVTQAKMQRQSKARVRE